METNIFKLSHQPFYNLLQIDHSMTRGKRVTRTSQSVSFLFQGFSDVGGYTFQVSSYYLVFLKRLSFIVLKKSLG